MLPLRRFFPGLCLMLVVWTSATPVIAQVSCERWNTADFLALAAVADVSRCLKVEDANARDESGWTPLRWAVVLSNTPAVVTALVKAGADPNARDQRGWTPHSSRPAPA